MVERVDDTTGSVVLLIPQTGQRFTLTSSATAAAAACQQLQGRNEERLVSRHTSANSSLLTRMRRRDSYARAAAAASAATNSASTTSTVTVGETGLVEGQSQLREEASQSSTAQSLPQEVHGNFSYAIYLTYSMFSRKFNQCLHLQKCRCLAAC